MNEQLCSKCKTGYENMPLDRKSDSCPYIASNNGTSCAFFQPLTKESEGDLDEGV